MALYEQLRTLQALEKAATPREWSHGIAGHRGIVSFDQDNVRFVGNVVHAEDEELLVTLRNAAPEIIAVLLAAEKAVPFVEEDSERHGLRKALEDLSKSLGGAVLPRAPKGTENAS